MQSTRKSLALAAQQIVGISSHHAASFRRDMEWLHGDGIQRAGCGRRERERHTRSLCLHQRAVVRPFRIKIKKN